MCEVIFFLISNGREIRESTCEELIEELPFVEEVLLSETIHSEGDSSNPVPTEIIRTRVRIDDNLRTVEGKKPKFLKPKELLTYLKGLVEQAQPGFAVDILDIKPADDTSFPFST